MFSTDCSSVLLRTGDGFNLVKLFFVISRRIFAGFQHVADQIVCQNQLGFGQPVKLQSNGAFFDGDQHFVVFNAQPIAPLKRLRPSISSAVSILAS